MKFEINRKDWEGFFNSLSKRRYEWKTRIEILKNEIGDQILTEGLPLTGFTVEAGHDRVSIDISVGDASGPHQTHMIVDPARVAFLAATDGYGDVIDIEESDGTKTLITFIEPMAIIVGYATATATTF